MKKLSLALILLVSGLVASSQQLRLGKHVSNMQRSAILELESDNQGLLLPRLTDTVLINVLTPPNGMIIYLGSNNKVMIRTGGHWEALVANAALQNYWTINGNTNGAVKTFGTADNYDLPFITNNAERLRILANGNVGINKTVPTEKLDVSGNFALSGAFMPGNTAGTSGYILRSTGAGTAPVWGVNSLANLSDATITTPANGQLLQYNGSKWVNITPTYLTTIDTSNIANFYLKVRGLLAAGTGIAYNNVTGVFTNTGVVSLNGNTGALTMDTGYISNFFNKVRSLTTASAPISYNNGVISINQASATTNGYLSSTDWNTFNNKLNSIDTGSIANFHIKVKSLFSAGSGLSYNSASGVFTNTGVVSLNGNTGALTMDTGYISNFFNKVRSLTTASAPISYTNGVISISQASATTNGYLSSTDWNTFNNKLNSIDTGSIANFHIKVKSLLSGGAGIGYNNATGVITNTGVVSLNGNTGALTMDTGYISNFYLKIRSEIGATAPITWANGKIGITQASSSTNGYLSSTDWNTFNNKLNSIDTGSIANFHLKVKSLFSAGTGLSYNNTTGAYANTGVLSLNGNTGALTMDTGYISTFHTKVKSLFSAGTGITYNAATGAISSSINTANFWNLAGNAGVTNGTNFLGTTDDRLLTLKANNTTLLEMGRRATLGLTQSYTDYTNDDEMVLHMKAAVQFYAPAAQFYKPKIYVDAYGNFRTKGSSAGTDYFEFGAIGTNNDGGFEFIVGDDGDEPILFKSYNYATGVTSETMRLQSGRMAVGSNSFNVSNPEKLLVDAGVTTSYNLMTGKGFINNYLQINVQNESNGNTASSDLVATSDNGDESNNYIDMGINSSGFTNTAYPVISGANTAYLYATGNDFVIGNATASKNLRLFTGGFAAANERMRIDGTGNVGIGTTAPVAKLDADGTFALGATGTVEKNIISFEITTAAIASVPAAAMTTVIPNSYMPGALDLTLTIPAASLPTTTRGTVNVSTSADLPAGVSIAWARIATTGTVKVRLMNASTTAGSIASGFKYYVTVTEF